jgi:hypothetical protein
MRRLRSKAKPALPSKLRYARSARLPDGYPYAAVGVSVSLLSAERLGEWTRT